MNTTLPDANREPELALEVAAWRLLRLALLVWASIVLIRHASYWGGVALNGGLFESLFGDPRPLLFAAVEIGALVMLLFTLLTSNTPTRANVAAVSRLSAIFIACNLLSFVLDLFTSKGTFDEGVLHVVWLVASRVQLLVVPAMAIVAWARARGRRANSGGRLSSNATGTEGTVESA